ncbi:MAG: TonB-dependent receptor [Daejeonella sp.]
MGSSGQEVASIKGIVRSSRGELLSGVNVHVKSLKLVAETDREGAYLFSTIPLNITITFSRLGYKTLSLELGLINSRENIQDVILFPEVQSLDEIHITEKFSGSNFKVMEPEKLSAYPNASGSFESFIKNMPGVSVNNELSSQYSVRGGNFNENLIYLNDIEIFRPLLISKGQQEGLGFVNPDMAGSVRFSAGGFEARYGDKLSSVLDVRYSRPDTLSLEASAGLLGSSATFKLPLKSSYLLAGVRVKRNRALLERQNLSGEYNSEFADYQLLYKQDLNQEFNVSFFGNYSKGRLKVSPGLRETEFGTSDEVLKLFVNYSGQELTNYESVIGAMTFAYNVSNTFNIKWISSLSRINESEETELLGLYTFDERDGLGAGKPGSFLGRGSQYDYSRGRLKSLIYNSEIRAYKQYRKSFLEFGLRLQNDEVQNQIIEFSGVDSTGYSRPGSGNWIYSDRIDEQNKVYIHRINGFLQNTYSLGPYITFAAGVRTNYNSFTKEMLLSPRFSLMYYPDNKDGFLLRFSAGSYTQTPYFRELINFDGTLNKNARSQRSIQLLSGADYKFNGLGTRLKFTSEIYYKFLSRITPYKIEDLRLRYFSDQQSTGYASGADFSLSGNFARDLESSFRVSFMKTEEDIKNDLYFISDAAGNKVPVEPGYLKRPSDQRVNFGILFQDRLVQNPTYKVHLNLFFASSLPTGPPGSQRYQDVFKIPAYKRVDLGFSKDFADPGSKRMLPFVKQYFQGLSVHAEIFNLLNIKNTASYLWLKDVNSIQYAVPDYLTFRKFNLRVTAKLKSK